MAGRYWAERRSVPTPAPDGGSAHRIAPEKASGQDIGPPCEPPSHGVCMPGIGRDQTGAGGRPDPTEHVGALTWWFNRA
jgi:hypothetical protein